MANEGTASVKVVGDVRDFARDTERDLNEALRKVKPDPVEVPADLEAARKNGEQAGEALGDGVTRGADGRLRDSRGKFIKAGEQAGSALGDGLTRGADGRIRDSRGKFVSAGEGVGSAAGEGARRGFLSRFGKIGDGMQKTLSTLGNVLGSALGGVASAVVPAVTAAGAAIGGTLLAGIAAVLGPGLASTVGAAITTLSGLGLGAGLLGLGAFALKDVEKLKSGLKGLTDTIKEVGREAAKPLIKPFAGALSDLSELVRQLGPEFKSIFTGLAPVIKPLNQAFGEFLGAIVRGVKDSLPGITAAFEGLTRVLPEIGEKFGDFFRTIFSNEELIDNTTEGLLRFATGPLSLLANVISGLNVAFGVYNNLIRLMAEENVLGKIGDAILTFVDGGTGAIDRITAAWGPLGEAIQNIWDKLKAFAAEDDAGKLATRFQEVVQAIKDAWGPLKEFLGTVWAEAIAFIKRLWEEEFVPFWNETARPFLETAIKAAFQIAWDAAKAIVSERIGQMKESIRAGVNAMPGIIRGALASIPGIIGSIFTSASAKAISTVLSMVAAVVRHFRSVGGKIRDALSNVKSSITGVFSGAAGWLRSAWTSIINGLIDGIRAGFGRVQSTLSSLTAMLPDWKGPEQVDKKILYKPGQMVMQGFEDGLRSDFDGIRRSLGDLTGSLAGAVPVSAKSSAAPTTITLGPGAIVINGGGADAGTAAAEALLERLAQTAVVR